MRMELHVKMTLTRSSVCVSTAIMVSTVSSIQPVSWGFIMLVSVQRAFIIRKRQVVAWMHFVTVGVSSHRKTFTF